jgi:hypothetical protein
MAELTPLESRYLDKALDTQLALWTALLQVEGLLLAVASVFASLAPSQALPAILIIATTLACGTLLIWNFVSTRNMYLKIGQTLGEKRPPSGGDIPQAGRLFRRLRTRERVVLTLLTLQGLLVIWAAVKMASR